MKEPLALLLILMTSMFVVAFACRMWAVKCGEVKLSHYETFHISKEPAYVTKTTNNLNNLSSSHLFLLQPGSLLLA